MCKDREDTEQEDVNELENICSARLCDAIWNLMLVSVLEHLRDKRFLHCSDCTSTILNMHANQQPAH